MLTVAKDICSFFSWHRSAGILPVVLLLFTTACENDEKAINDLNSKRPGVEEAKNVRVNYTQAGKAKAVLTAPLMYRVQDTLPYTEFTKTIHVDFYNDTAGIDSRLDARYARYIESQSKVFLKDSVRLMNTEGDTLYCDELYWDRSRVGREFYTEKPIRIRTRTHIINGIGMEASQDFKNKLITKSTGFIKIPARQFPE